MYKASMETNGNYEYLFNSTVYRDWWGFPSFPGVINEIQVQVTLLQYD